MDKIINFKLILGLFIFILVLHILATVNHWYWIYKWLDIPMHFLGGLWLAMIFFWLIHPHLDFKGHRAILVIVLSLAFVAFLGVLWEFWEFVHDFFFTKNLYFGNQFIIEKRIDVVKDLFFDLVGGLVLTLLFLFQVKSQKKSFST